MASDVSGSYGASLVILDSSSSALSLLLVELDPSKQNRRLQWVIDLSHAVFSWRHAAIWSVLGWGVGPSHQHPYFSVSDSLFLISLQLEIMKIGQPNPLGLTRSLLHTQSASPHLPSSPHPTSHTFLTIPTFWRTYLYSAFIVVAVSLA